MERVSHLMSDLSMPEHYPRCVQIVVFGFLWIAIRVHPSKVLSEISKIRECTIYR
jgi:hypothetical protein